MKHHKMLTATTVALSLMFTSFNVQAMTEEQMNRMESLYNQGQYQDVIEMILPLAPQGDAEAQYNLGLLYEQGQGVPKDDAKAAYWYELAAKQGYTSAQKALEKLRQMGY